MNEITVLKLNDLKFSARRFYSNFELTKVEIAVYGSTVTELKSNRDKYAPFFWEFKHWIYSLLGYFTHTRLTDLGSKHLGNCHGRTGAGTQ